LGKYIILTGSFKVFSMNPWIVAAWLVTTGSVVGLGAAVLWLWHGSRRNGESGGGSADPGLSFARYQVMERLLSPRDLQFLAAQPGRAAAARGWKRESLRIFRMYLAELTADFHTLHGHARRMVVESQAESPELAAALVRQQVTFYRARVTLEFRLLLFAMGIGHIDVVPLLRMVEAMQIDLGRIVPEGAPGL
jgi:hypothetical protein